MTVNLKCGNYKADDMGGYYEIECNYVIEDDLQLSDKKATVSKSMVIEALNKMNQSELLKILKETDIDPSDLVYVDCNPDVSWGWL